MSTAVPPNTSPVPTTAADIGPDGEKVVDMTFYDLLGVRGDATALELKKAYRTQSLRWHPDRNVNGDPTASAKFQAISEAYTCLADGNTRASYNKHGIKQTGAGAEGDAMGPGDAGAMFAQMFGGTAFFDWIGEISLGKDVAKAFESATEEEKEAAKVEATTAAPAPTAVQSTLSHSSFTAVPSAPAVPVAVASVPSSSPLSQATATTSTTFTNASAPSASESTPPVATTPAAPAEKVRMTPEQRAEQYKQDQERAEEKKERIRLLAEKLVTRCRPFVESSNPGANDDPETLRFAQRIKEESTDLAMASFGTELCHLIGTIYMSKGAAYIRLHKSSASNFLGVPGWWNRVREKGKMLKEGYAFLSVGLDVHSAMKDMQSKQEAGELDEEGVKQLEMDMSGILLLVAWKGSKFELSTLLRQVVDQALSKADEVTLMNRAKAILLCGAILKSVVPDESDVERRELERMVANADAKRKEKKKRSVPAAPSPAPVLATKAAPL